MAGKERTREYIDRGLSCFCSKLCIERFIKGRPIIDPKQRVWSSGCLTGDERVIDQAAYVVSQLTGDGYRSNFERNVGDWLYLLEEEYEIEPVTFEVGKTGHVTPDLLLPRRDLLIEVKGVWALGQKAKFSRFLEEWLPQIDIIMIPWRLHAEFENGDGGEWD